MREDSYNLNMYASMDRAIQEQVQVSAFEKIALFFLFLMVLSMPFVDFSPEKTPMASRWQRIVFTDIMGGFAILFALVSGTHQNRKSFFVWALPFLVWCTIGVLISFSNAQLSSAPIEYRVMGVMIMWYVFMLSSFGSKLVRDENTLKLLLIALTIGAAVESIIAVHDSLGVLGIGSVWFRGDDPHRIRGTFRASGSIGQYGMGILCLCYMFAAWPGMKKFVRVIVTYVAITGGAAAFFASRRSAVYCILLWGMLLVLRALVTKSGRKSIFFLVGTVLLSIIMVWQTFSSYEFSEYTQSRYEERSPNPTQLFAEGSWTRGQVEDAWNIFKNHPITGCGLEHAVFLVKESGNEIHNGFLAILAETGSVGVVLILIPIGLVAAKLKRIYRLSRETIWADFVERLILPFIIWIPFSVHNRVWRDRTFWVAIIIVFAMESILERDSWNYLQENEIESGL